MHDARLDDRAWENGFNCVRGAFEAVAAGDEDVLDASVPQLGDHLEPELGAFGRLDPEAEDLLNPSGPRRIALRS
jgi:hypothetical protein